MCSEMGRWPRHCWTGSRITAIFWKPATTATGSRTAPHSNHHRPPRRRRRPRTYPQREREVHEPGWVRSRWKWWVRFAWKSTAPLLPVLGPATIGEISRKFPPNDRTEKASTHKQCAFTWWLSRIAEQSTHDSRL